MSRLKLLNDFSLGTDAGYGTLHILLVSTSQKYLDEIQKSLHVIRLIQSDKRLYTVKVHTCKHVSDVMRLSSSDFFVDYVILILDVENKNCLLQVQDNINVLNSSFGREKMCIINPIPSFGQAVIKPPEVWEFASKMQLNLINGRVDDPERIGNLCKRILNLAQACCGTINGIPLVGYV